jgi:uncharacterized protein
MDGGGTRSIRLIENTYIPLSDGVRVAAKIWLPQDAERHPVPAILEMLPYRKRDGTLYRDVRMHPWIAARGYAGVRVDIRGSGESEGCWRMNICRGSSRTGWRSSTGCRASPGAAAASA